MAPGKQPDNKGGKHGGRVATVMPRQQCVLTANQLGQSIANMAVVSVANQKGGVGKSTIAVNLAAGFAREGQGSVLAIDADPSQSLTKHFSRRGEMELPFTIVGGATPDLHKNVPSLLRHGGFRLAIIDCPAGSSLITRSALLASDVIVIPVQPSLADFDSAELLLPLLDDIALVRPHVQVLIVISRKLPGNNSYSRQAAEAAGNAFLGEGQSQRSVLRTAITNRADLVRCYSSGQTIFEHSPGSTSRFEFDELTEEIGGWLHRT